MEATKEKPAYVTFEYRSIEDRDATIAAGHFIGHDVAYAILTPQGSKDKIERVADEWIKLMGQMVVEDRFPPNWLDAYKSAYKQWQEGREIPLDGTPIITWPAISQSQQKSLLDCNIRTVEDLANANESVLSALGMGSRALKDRAVKWLDEAANIGKSAEIRAAVEAENLDLKNTVETLSSQIAEMKKSLAALESKKA